MDDFERKMLEIDKKIREQDKIELETTPHTPIDFTPVKLFLASIDPGISESMRAYRREEFDLAIHKEKMANLVSDTSQNAAEIRLLNAQAKTEEMKAWREEEMNLMLKYIRVNDLKDFPVELKYFVIACQAGDPTALNDIMSANILKEYLHRKQEAEVLKTEQDAELRRREVEEKDLHNENLRHNLNTKKDRPKK